MTIRAVYFDLGGVIVRTEFQAPRQHLAERFGVEYDVLVKQVFDSETADQASLGLISEQKHWAAVARRLHMPRRSPCRGPLPATSWPVPQRQCWV